MTDRDQAGISTIHSTHWSVSVQVAMGRMSEESVAGLTGTVKTGFQVGLSCLLLCQGPLSACAGRCPCGLLSCRCREDGLELALAWILQCMQYFDTQSLFISTSQAYGVPDWQPALLNAVHSPMEGCTHLTHWCGFGVASLSLTKKRKTCTVMGALANIWIIIVFSSACMARCMIGQEDKVGGALWINTDNTMSLQSALAGCNALLHSSDSGQHRLMDHPGAVSSHAERPLYHS